MAISGMLSSLASAMAVTRFVAPGPLVAMHTPGLPVLRATPWAANAAALLVPRQNRAQLVGKRVSAWCSGMLAAAGIGEDRVDAVVDQRLDEDVGPARELGLGLGLGDSRHGGLPRYGKRWIEVDQQGHDTAGCRFASSRAVNLSMISGWRPKLKKRLAAEKCRLLAPREECRGRSRNRAARSGVTRAPSADRDNQPLPPTRCGTVNEYSTTTAPVPNRLHGAQSGGITSRVADWAWLGVTFSTAFSTASASTPNKQQYAPTARKNDRHMGTPLCLVLNYVWPGLRGFDLKYRRISTAV